MENKKDNNKFKVGKVTEYKTISIFNKLFITVSCNTKKLNKKGEEKNGRIK